MRIQGLVQVDPARVPLPVGTEVITSVDRMHGDRRVPQGAVGRVASSHDDHYVVAVAGVGKLEYRRAELVARNSGQLRFAVRREGDWSQLQPCIVLETIVGSRAWGLADANSDVDRRGAYVAPAAWSFGLTPCPGELVSVDGSSTYWEVGKLVEQALRADPNTLETLFVDGARPLDELGQWLLDEREAFVSQAIYGSFARYALSQLDKLRRALRLAEHQQLLLEWLRLDPSMPLDAVAERLAGAVELEAPTRADAVLLAKQHVKQLYHSLHDRGLLAHADFASLVAYARDGGVALELARELRPKNAYNLLRLVATAIGWLRTGTPAFVVDAPMLERLGAIKRGEVELAAVLRDAEALAPELEEARQHSPLPRHADLQRADALLRRMRTEVARRMILGLPGPWGRDAPPPREPEWETTT